jgi:hypothetical protein
LKTPALGGGLLLVTSRGCPLALSLPLLEDLGQLIQISRVPLRNLSYAATHAATHANASQVGNVNR